LDGLPYAEHRDLGVQDAGWLQAGRRDVIRASWTGVDYLQA
jgi:hypothetical protein